MAEFSEVMKQIKRICNANDYKCTDCPMSAQSFCQMSAFDMEGFEAIENIVMAWAAEHPVVYPTWGEWLQKMGVMTDIHDRLNNYKQVMEVCGKPLYSIPTAKVLCPIPADIAQKLGVEPKEG